MKLGQLSEHDMRNIFLEKSQNVVEKLFPDPFLKNQNWTYIWIIGKLQSLVSEDNFFCCVYNDLCSNFLLYDVLNFVRM